MVETVGYRWMSEGCRPGHGVEDDEQQVNDEDEGWRAIGQDR